MLSRHTESGMHPRPTENETHMLAPDLNRGMTTEMDRVDVNAHLDDTGISHGTKQGLMRFSGKRKRNQIQPKVSFQTPAPQMTKLMPSPKQVHYMKSPRHFMTSHPTLQWQQ